ncbi:hypothetical protein [Clostridium gasigenes]|uniref:hypothetical protein n=1 Tax=Clostridium gasigenes TaxID=94869 RepID=UPI001C0C1FDC|nr:hypothetical protein [Clostridium gasigenes]MBU3108557.1 hypothetical protein [Clostridium gasigenes]
MIYYLKHYDTLVAIIDLDRKVMEIEKPNLFTDRMDKLVVLGSDLDKWIENRVTPGSQKGFNKLVAHLGIAEDSEIIFIELLIATKGVNVKDRLWLTDNEFDENSPWNNLLDEDYDLIQKVDDSGILSDDILHLIQTKNRLSINMDGACEKTLIRLNGDLAICKKATQNNTCDSIMEEVIYNLGVSMGLDMAPAGYLGNKTCYSVIDENVDLIMACDLFKRDDLDYEYCYRELRKMKCDKQTLTTYLRMLLFDIITRQIDRNSCNFGFYKTTANNIKMYRLYDNGLSLFAHNTSGINRKTFATRLGNSEDIMKFTIKELKRLGVKNLFKKPFKASNLQWGLTLHKEEIENILSVDINEIVNWAADRYNEIVDYSESYKS